MFDRIRARLLHFLRVPPDPAPPAGAPGSLRAFRGGRNLYKLRLLAWLLGQAGAVVGIGFSLYFLDRMEAAHAEAKRIAATPVPAASPRPAAEAAPAPATTATAAAPAVAPAADAATKKTKSKLSPEARQRARGGLARVVERWPWWIFPLLRFLEWGGIALFLFQIPVTYAMVRLDFELRWYLVTDRSLRIRTGIATVKESTMSFANVQQVVVTQGPLQRLLGLADVRVQSAGGGGDTHEQKGGESLHTGVFHGVSNAHEIRDLILERLRQFRETGLGDPDEPGRAASAPGGADAAASPPPAALAAAHELLAEARALRRALG